MNSADTLQTSKWDELVNNAKDAALAGDMRGVLHALQQSEVFDGFMRRLQNRWPMLHEDDLLAVLWSEVVDAFYETVRKGTNIVNVKIWLWKTAWYKTVNLHAERRRNVSIGSTEVPDASVDEHSVWDDGEEVRSVRVNHAIELARGLIPRLGEQNVQNVMRYIFDCYSAGNWEITNESIGVAIGQSSDSVRLWRSRGFARLVREARNERLVNPDFDIRHIQDKEPDEGTEPE